MMFSQKLVALMLLMASTSMASTDSMMRKKRSGEEPTNDPCAESGVCPDECDECGVVCNPDDKDNADPPKCEACIETHKCEECMKCEMERKEKQMEEAPTDAAPSEGLIQQQTDVDPCAESGVCPDECDECGTVCNPDDKDNADPQKCEVCIETNKCQECMKCEMERKEKQMEEAPTDAAPSAGLIQQQTDVDPCAESGVCHDECDECGTVCNPDDKDNADPQKCEVCIETHKCEECMKCEMERKEKKTEESVKE